jgi:hypothetical protein
MALNPFDTGTELHARVSEILLKLKLTQALTQTEMADLAYACGIQVPPLPTEPVPETRLQRLQRLVVEAKQAALRG